MNTGIALVGQSLVAHLVPLKDDGVTVNTTAVVSSPSFSISDPSIAALSNNGDGTASVSALAAGTATVTASAVVTDSDGKVQLLSAMGTLTVSEQPPPPPPADRTASLGIEFSAAQ